jgi:hypothetical protein
MSATTRKPRLTRRLRCVRLEDRTAPAVIAWDGGPTGNGTDWLDPVNWAGDVLPGAGDDVIIGSTGTNPTIHVAGLTPAEAKAVTSSRRINITGSLILDGNSTLAEVSLTGTLRTGATVTATGLFSLLGGTLDGIGGAGRLIAAGGAHLTGSNAGPHLDHGFVLETPAGAAHTWDGGYLSNIRGARWENAGVLTIAFAGSYHFGSDHSPGTAFVNTGSVTVNGGVVMFPTDVTNAGTIQVVAGTLRLGEAGSAMLPPATATVTGTGAITGAVGTTVRFDTPGTARFGSVIDVDRLEANGGLFAGSFRANVLAGNATFTGTVQRIARIEPGNNGHWPGGAELSVATLLPGAEVFDSLYLSGTLTTGATITVAGLFTDAGGQLHGHNGSGRLIAAGGSSLMGSNVGHFLDHGFVLETPAGVNHTWSGGYLNNIRGSRWENAGNLNIAFAGSYWFGADFSAGAAFVNTGTVDVTVTGTVWFAEDVINSGTIRVHTGTLRLGDTHPLLGTATVLTATGRILGDPGTTLLCQKPVTAAAGSVIDVDRVEANGGLFAGSFRANALAGNATFTGTVQRIARIEPGNSGHWPGGADLSAATLLPGAEVLDSLHLTGTLRTGATLTVAGPFTHQGGLLRGHNGAGRLVAQSVASVVGVHGNTLAIDGGFTLELPAGSSSSWANGGLLRLGGQGDGHIDNAGTFTISSAGDLLFDSNTVASSFRNSGTVTFAVAGTAAVQLEVVNSGSMHVHSGVLELSYPGSTAFTASAASQLTGAVNAVDPG